MCYNILKFKMEHLDSFNARQEQLVEIKWLHENLIYQDLWVYKLPVFTLMYEDTPIMIYGMINSGVGTYTPMVYAAEGVDKHTLRMIRCIYKYVDEFVGDDVRRFEALAAASDKKTAKLAKFFGFELIGIKRQSGVNGEDQAIYERLWRK